MTRIQQIIVQYGDSFTKDPYWKYYSTIDFHNIVRIFKEGILSKNELYKKGLYEFTPNDNSFEKDAITLYEIKDKETLIKEVIKHQDAIIVSSDVPVTHYRVYVQKNTGLKAHFKVLDIQSKPISEDTGVVEAYDKIFPMELVGIKIGDFSDTTLTLVTVLLTHNIDVELYDLVIGKKIMASKLMNLIKDMDENKKKKLS